MIDLNKKEEELESRVNASMGKTLNPGQHVCTINSITYKDGYKEGSLVVQLNLEGPDLGEGFVGFARDKDNPAMGTYSGQVGRVDLTQYAFEDKKDVKLPNGKTFDVEIVTSVLNELRNLAIACSEDGESKKKELMQGAVDKIEEFIDNASTLLSGSKLNFTIAGKEWINNQGYSQYNLFLPKVKGSLTPYELDGTEPSNLVPFDPATMLIAAKNKARANAVAEFAPADDLPF